MVTAAPALLNVSDKGKGKSQAVDNNNNTVAALQAALRSGGYSPLQIDTGTDASRIVAKMPESVRAALEQIMNHRLIVLHL